MSVESHQLERTPYSMKRNRSITDFFISKRQRPLSENTCTSLASSPLEPTVPSLSILQEFVSDSEEQLLLEFLNDPQKCTWRTDLKRRCMHFGGTYCLYTPPAPETPAKTPASSSNHHISTGENDKGQPKSQVLRAPDMPTELSWLLKRFVAKGVFDQDQAPQYCIVNEYVDDHGISAHVENFSFGEPVVGLSLLDPVHMRFHELVKEDGGSVRSGKAAKAEKTGRYVDVLLPGRSLCVMGGESRWKWQHEIIRSRKGRKYGWKRVSLTFRWKKGG